MSSVSTTRRPKWKYPQAQPTPRILHLPRRPRRRSSNTRSAKPTSSLDQKKGKLEALFDQERVFSKANNSCGGETERRREKVEEEDKRRFQAERLRAECKLLRMEREIAFNKMDKMKSQMERILRSTFQTLISGRKKISESTNLKMLLEEEILELADKLAKLQRSSELKDFIPHSTSCNFDKQAFLIRKRLEKFERKSNELSVKKIQEMAEASLSIKPKSKVDENLTSRNNFIVEILRRKMDELSKGTLLEKMKEDCGSMLSTASSSTSTSKRIESHDFSSSKQKSYPSNDHNNMCSGHCKEIVRKIMDQVRAEIEQWSQMQVMLGQVREEMEDLQSSRDYWETRALTSNSQIQSLHSSVAEWRQRAISSESNTIDLQAQIVVLNGEVEKSREGRNGERAKEKCSEFAWEEQNEMEKRVLVCRLKENRRIPDVQNRRKEGLNDDRKTLSSCSSSSSNGRSLPFRDIGNLSVLHRQNSRVVLPLHWHVSNESENVDI